MMPPEHENMISVLHLVVDFVQHANRPCTREELGTACERIRTRLLDEMCKLGQEGYYRVAPKVWHAVDRVLELTSTSSIKKDNAAWYTEWKSDPSGVYRYTTFGRIRDACLVALQPSRLGSPISEQTYNEQIAGRMRLLAHNGWEI